MRYSLLIVTCLVFLFSCKTDNSTTPNSESKDQTSSASGINKSLPDYAKNATIYEVNMRQYTEEGTFLSFIPHVDRLANMGVDILWFMPIYPISEKNRKGTLGSPYAVADYKNTNPEFGSIQDFDKMVTAIHDAGMKIILDWVPNHTGWDNPWITEHPEWYTQDKDGNIIDPIDYNTGESWGWTDVADLNFDNKEMRKEMISSLNWWVNERNIDGFRMDVAHGVPDDFWDECSDALFANANIFMLSEGEVPNHRNNENFHMDYGWSFHHILNDIAKGEKNVTDLYQWKAENDEKYQKGMHMNFTSNHDENSWAGTEFERMGDGHLAFAALVQTWEGMPLIYSGQEEPLKKRLEFFEKDPIPFENFAYEEFYTTLNKLKADNKALWNGEHGGQLKFIGESESVVGFEREKDGDKVTVIINLTNQPTEFNVITHISGVKDVFTGKTVHYHDGDNIPLKPYEYIIAGSSIELQNQH